METASEGGDIDVEVDDAIGSEGAGGAVCDVVIEPVLVGLEVVVGPGVLALEEVAQHDRAGVACLVEHSHGDGVEPVGEGSEGDAEVDYSCRRHIDGLAVFEIAVDPVLVLLDDVVAGDGSLRLDEILDGDGADVACLVEHTHGDGVETRSQSLDVFGEVDDPNCRHGRSLAVFEIAVDPVLVLLDDVVAGDGSLRLDEILDGDGADVACLVEHTHGDGVETRSQSPDLFGEVDDPSRRHGRRLALVEVGVDPVLVLLDDVVAGGGSLWLDEILDGDGADVACLVEHTHGDGVETRSQSPDLFGEVDDSSCRHGRRLALVEVLVDPVFTVGEGIGGGGVSHELDEILDGDRAFGSVVVDDEDGEAMQSVGEGVEIDRGLKIPRGILRSAVVVLAIEPVLALGNGVLSREERAANQGEQCQSDVYDSVHDKKR